MDEAKRFLAQWLIDYLKNRDLHFRKIEHIEHKDDVVIVRQKDKTTIHYVLAFEHNILDHLNNLDSEKQYCFVFYNTQENLVALKQHWEQLKEHKNLSFYFVNPFSKMDKRWIVFPNTHHRIADPKSLHTGLDAMFDTVEPVTEEDVNRILRG